MSIWQNYMKITAIILLILLISYACKEAGNAREVTKSSQIKNGDIFTDLDLFWEKINSFDISLKREEYIKSLSGKSVAWKLYVYDVEPGTELDPKRKYSLEPKYITSYRIELTRYSEGSVFPGAPLRSYPLDSGAPSFTTFNKEIALAFSKGDKVTLKGTFNGIIFLPIVENPTLVKGWE